jgi:quercetin dioxygenase-like cupin family protein
MNGHDSVLEFQHAAWDAIPVERVADGIERQLIWGERLMVCRVRFAPHIATALHTHPHEQMTLVQKGRVRFTVNGLTVEASAGDVLCFPPQLEHGATMLDEEVILLDIFTPVREDFLPQRADVARQ